MPVEQLADTQKAEDFARQVERFGGDSLVDEQILAQFLGETPAGI